MKRGFVSSPGFSKRKFLTLTRFQQHKKCCEMLRTAYDSITSKEALLQSYQEVVTWMGLQPPTSPFCRQLVADQFHWHLQQLGCGLKEHHLLPKISHEDASEGEAPLPIAIYLDHIRSAHNIGSIIRTTEALRLGTIYCSEGMAFVDHKQVQDAAMGSQEWVNSHRNIALKTLPRPIICLETSQQALRLHEFIFPAEFTLVVGNEEYGCSEEALALADHILYIPLHGRKNSLNVANAFAITAAEVRRQHHLNMNGKEPW